MFNYLFSINKKYTKESVAYCEIKLEHKILDDFYPPNEIYNILKLKTGIIVDGETNYIEWIEI